jgi:hypothetical protein
MEYIKKDGILLGQLYHMVYMNIDGIHLGDICLCWCLPVADRLPPTNRKEICGISLVI